MLIGSPERSREPWPRALNHLATRRQRQPEVSGAAETRARHSQDSLLHQLSNESEVVGNRSLRKDVESTPRNIEPVADLLQDGAHPVAAALVFGDFGR